MAVRRDGDQGSGREAVLQSRHGASVPSAGLGCVCPLLSQASCLLAAVECLILCINPSEIIFSGLF